MATDKPCNCKKVRVESISTKKAVAMRPSEVVHSYDEPTDFEVAVTDALIKLNSPYLPSDLPPGWENRTEVHEAVRRALDKKSKELREEKYPGGYEGRGIVISGGGSIYFTAAYVCIYLLRKIHKCELPIEVWHLGREEMDAKMARILNDLGGVVTVDAKACPDSAKITGGWELKAYSLVNSRFKDVLFLDADQIPVRDPEFLFDTPEYKNYGAFLWPDLTPWGWCMTEQAFKTAGLYVPGNTKNPSWSKPTDYTPVESGQILVDKERCWKELQLALYINEQSYYWYRNTQSRRTWHIYGDKDTFYIAWQKFRTRYYVPPPVSWTGSDSSGAFMQKSPDGQLLFQHKCQPGTKWSLHGKNLKAPGLQYFDECLAALEDLKLKWVGHPWDWSDQEEHDLKVSNELAGKAYTFTAGNKLTKRITLHSGGAITGGDENTHHWAVIHQDGDPVVVISGYRKGGYFLKQQSDGRWKNDNGQVVLADINAPVVDTFYEIDRLNGGIVVDTNAGDGSFAQSCFGHGASKVVCTEADHKTYVRLCSLLKSSKQRAHVYRGVVCSDTLPKSKELKMIADNIQPIALSKLLIKAGHRIRLLKLDLLDSCELLLDCANLGKVTEIVGKYGAQNKETIESFLKEHFVEVSIKEPDENNIGLYKAKTWKSR